MKSRADDLTCLLAVVDSGGFSAAAEVLGTSVARVSRAVARLEQTLDTALLIRTTRQVSLTDDGAVFVSEVREGLAALETAEEALAMRRQNPSGILRVDAANPFLLHQIVPHVAAFNDAYPLVRLELSASDQIVDLLEKRIDVAIRIGTLEDSTLRARLLGRSPLSIVASPDYLAHHGRPQTASEIAGHRVIGFTGPDTLNVWHLGAGHRVRPNVAASSGEAVRQLCLRGNGLAYLSRFMVAEDLASGALEAVLDDALTRPNAREPVNAVYYRNSGIAARIQVFMDFFAPRFRL